MIEFIKENALKIAQESKKKLTSARAKNASSAGPNRPYSSQPFHQGGGRPISGISAKSKASIATTDLKM